MSMHSAAQLNRTSDEYKERTIPTSPGSDDVSAVSVVLLVCVFYAVHSHGVVSTIHMQHLARDA